MKKIILVLFILSFSVICSAEVYLVVNKDTNKILYFGKDPKEVVMDNSMEVKVLAGGKEDYQLQYPISYYTFKANKFSVDQQKIDTETQLEQASVSVKQKKQSDKVKAIEKLKALGLTEDEINSLSQ